jgi:hypothetical protein
MAIILSRDLHPMKEISIYTFNINPMKKYIPLINIIIQHDK